MESVEHRRLVVRDIGGRLTKDTAADTFALSTSNFASTVMPPTTAEDTWRVERLDIDALERKDPNDLIQLMCDLSPDISRALWDFLRMCNPGWSLKAYRTGDSKAIDTKAQAACDLFVTTLTDTHGDFNLCCNRLFIMAFLRGAFLSELVLSADGQTGIDLATPDPLPIRFERVWTQERGTHYRMFEWVDTPQGRQKVYLDVPTIKYIPVDPFPGVPYGRSLVSPALFSTLFLLVLLHDIRRVVQQQGYPRIDISIDMEKLSMTMPDDLGDDPKAVENWVNKAVSDVVEMYSNIRADQAYVHTDIVTLNRPIGTVDTSSLGALPNIINILERMTVRALKTVPIVLGHADSVSEANANRQWEIYAAGVKALQHFAEVLLEHNFNLLLRAQGIQAKVEFRFSELRAAELLRDTQVELLRAKVADAVYHLGYWSQDEAALYATGKEKADVPGPRLRKSPETADTGAGAVASAQPDPGSTRILTDAMAHDLIDALERINPEQAPTEQEMRELIESIAREIFSADAIKTNGHVNGHA